MPAGSPAKRASLVASITGRCSDERFRKSAMLLTIEDLAVRLHTTPVALYCRRSRNLQSLPPNVRLPGDSRLLFDESTVEAWLADPTVFLPKPAGRPRKLDLYPMPRKSPSTKGGRPSKVTVAEHQGVQP